MQSPEPTKHTEPFSSAIETSLVPDYYTERLDVSKSPLALAITTPLNYQNSPLLFIPGFKRLAHKLSTARYGLFIREWPQASGPTRAVEIVRKEIQTLTGALWCRRGVGAYVVLYGKKQLWQSQQVRTLLDSTGLHAVVIQSIHFIDLESGETTLSNTTYHTPQKYSTADVSSRIDELLSSPDLICKCNS